MVRLVDFFYEPLLLNWLNNAHKKLDAAVFTAYGWSNDLGDEEILERLLALNLQQAKQ